MRKALLALGLGLALLIGGAFVLLLVSPTSVTVRNDSSQTITTVSVTVQGRTLNFPNLPPGDSARRWFHNTGADGHYSLVAHRSDGTQIQRDEGYITSGSFYGSAQFTITPSGDVTFTEDY
ncbi:MAG: hypothetical protein WCF18_07705 [Chthoniobacteraceae bacterium]